MEKTADATSGQLFAVVVMGGAATPKGVFAALTTHAKSRSSGQRTGRTPAVRCAGSGRAPRVSRGRKIIPVVNSHRCCRRGHAQHLCPWPKPPQWAPAEKLERREAPS
eukprot:scaffold11573_cov114-Isochrysis_galbana.AAC.2